MGKLCDIENCRNLALKFFFQGAKKVQVCQQHLADLTEASYDISTIHTLASFEDALPHKRTRFEAFGKETEVREKQLRLEASRCAERAHAECMATHYEAALHLWEKALDLLALNFPMDKQTVTVCLELGWVLSQHLGRLLEAQKVIQQGLDIVQTLHITSEKVESEGWLRRVLVANVEYKDAEVLLRKSIELGQEYYQNMSNASAAICCLGWIYLKKQDRLRETEAFLDFYFSGNDSLASEGKALSSMLLAEVCRINGNPYIAEEKLKESLQFYEASSNSLEVAKTLCLLGNLYAEPMKLYEEAERKYVAALKIYSVESPASEVHAETLCKLGNLYIKDMERYSVGEEMYQAAINVLAPVSPICLADVLCRFAGLYITSMDRYQAGEQKLKEAIALYAVHSPTRMAEALVKLGELYLQVIERYEDGDQRFQEAIQMYRNIGSASTDLADTLFKLGEIDIKDRGQYLVGEQKIQTAMELYVTGSSRTQAAALCRLALLYIEPLHRHEAAEQSYKKAIELYRVHDGAATDLTNAMCSLAKFYFDTNQHINGEELCKEAVAIQTSKHPKSISLARLLSNIGDLYSSMKRYDTAEQQYQQAIELWRGVDPAAVSLADQLCKLGELYKVEQRHQDEEEKLKEALAIHVAHSPISPQAADTLSLLAGLYENALERYTEAERTYREAVTIHTLNGPTSLAVANSLWKLGEFYFLTLRVHVDGEAVFKQALEIYRSRPISLAKALSLLAKYYDDDEDGLYPQEESEQAYKAAIEIYIANCPSTLRLSDALCTLGKFYIDKQRNIEGEQKLQEAIETCLAMAPHSRHEAEVLSTLACTYANSKGKCNAAATKYREALAIHTINCPTSIYTANSMRKLGYLNVFQLKQMDDGERCYKSAIEIYTANKAMHLVTATLFDLGKTFIPHGDYGMRLLPLFDGKAPVFKFAIAYHVENRDKTAEQMTKEMIEMYDAKCSSTVNLLDVLCGMSEPYRLKLQTKLEQEQAEIEQQRKDPVVFPPWVQDAPALQSPKETDPTLRYQQVIDIWNTSYPKSLRLADVQLQLAFIYLVRDRYEDAEQCYIAAINIHAVNHSRSVLLADLTSKLGDLYASKMQRYTDADKKYKEALMLLNGANWSESGDCVRSIKFSIAKLYIDSMGNYGDAEQRLVGALKSPLYCSRGHVTDIPRKLLSIYGVHRPKHRHYAII